MRGHAPTGGSTGVGFGFGAGCCATSEIGSTKPARIDLTTTICLPRTVAGDTVLPGAPALEGRLLIIGEYLTDIRAYQHAQAVELGPHVIPYRAHGRIPADQDGLHRIALRRTEAEL